MLRGTCRADISAKPQPKNRGPAELMKTTINEYGDILLPTTGAHGGDVSSQRMDDLDLACLDFARQGASRDAERPLALDIGGGYGAQSKRMAQLGAEVTLVDLTDQAANVAGFNRDLAREAIRFFQADIRTLRWCRHFDIVYSQRMISCIPFRDAQAVLTDLRRLSRRGAHFFISAGGLHTEIGMQYPHRELDVSERFSSISPAMAVKHQMTAPECLYSEAELAELLSSCGLSIVRSWTSPFGNPKVIAANLTGEQTI
jgi:SAM-dependent methyltransferase